jgi:hypothetical protein
MPDIKHELTPVEGELEDLISSLPEAHGLFYEWWELGTNRSSAK